VANSGGPRILGRIFVLLILILALAGGGVLWFDYLNIIDAKTFLAPVFERIPFLRGSGRSQASLPVQEAQLDLDAERLAVRLEALELRNMELDKREQDIQNRMGEINQMAQDLEERQKALDEREKSFNAQLSDADIKNRSIESNARNLTGMPPERAVGILTAMDDQDIIDVLRKTDEIAQAEGSSSIVPYWLSLMESGRAAEISRKMVGRPSGLD
jgi:flagellar protein FlbB